MRKTAVATSCGHAALDVLELALHGDAERLEVARGVPAHGGEEAEVVEDGGTQVEDDAVQVVEGASREALDLLEARARLALGQIAERALEPEGQGRDRLARFVVQLARDAHALAFLRAQETLEQFGAPVVALEARAHRLERAAEPADLVVGQRRDGLWEDRRP